MIDKPYLLLVGDTEDPRSAKTALGLRDWVPTACLGQLRFADRAINLDLPDMSLTQAVAAGAKTLVIGIAPLGGRLPTHWIPTLTGALEAGLNIAAGLHQRLSDIPEVAECASRFGRRLHDVRHSDRAFAVGTGEKRTGRRLLTVGTDCALGKKYTALAIAQRLAARDENVDFRATGQTGILIAGSGVAVDAVVADFIAGAAESLSPANAADHWDIIEGQGSLFHPAYSAVTLGLLHGSQPDALVLCHDPSRTSLNGFAHVPVRSPEQAIEPYLHAARLTNSSARFVGISLNTSSMSASTASEIIAKTSASLRLPCVDPIRTGVDPIVDMLLQFGST